MIKAIEIDTQVPEQKEFSNSDYVSSKLMTVWTRPRQKCMKCIIF